MYLTVLSCADIIVLNTGLLKNWVLYTFNIDIRELSDVMCRYNLWTIYTALDLSAWMLVAVTVELVGFVYYPTKFKTICSKCTAICVVFVIIVFSIFIKRPSFDNEW